MSASVMAEAIQSASRWWTRPVSAVTSPPPPRRATSSPFSSRSKAAGPRFDTSTIWVSVLIAAIRSRELAEDLEPVAHQARGEEVGPHVLLAGAPEMLAEPGVAQDPQRPVGALLGARDQVAGGAVLDLQRDAA